MYFKSNMLKRILFKPKPIRLGRWKMEQSNKALLRKIDLANCDSCGTCNVTDVKKKCNKYIRIEDDIVIIVN